MRAPDLEAIAAAAAEEAKNRNRDVEWVESATQELSKMEAPGAAVPPTISFTAGTPGSYVWFDGGHKWETKLQPPTLQAPQLGAKVRIHHGTE